MLNKPTFAPVAPSSRASWFGPGGWRLPYAPDFANKAEGSFYVGDPFTLTLDVSDLTDKHNEIRLENSLATSVAKRVNIEGTLVLDHLTIDFTPGKSRVLRPNRPSDLLQAVGRPSSGSAEAEVTIAPGGGIILSSGSQTWTVSSRFSYPNAGWNRLIPTPQADRDGQDSWQVQPAERGCLAVAPDYNIQRTVRRGPHAIEISDAITNLRSHAPLGLVVSHELDLNKIEEPEIRLAGNADPSLNEYYSPGNPSVHVATANGAIGLLCEDDVFRNQATLYFHGLAQAETPVAGLRTEMLRLAPAETYTLRWSIYPMKGPDYFDFVNLVRQDWDANQTVQGAWVCGFDPDVILATDDRYLRTQFDRLGIRLAVLGGGWIDRKQDPRRIGFGAGVLENYWADYRRRITLSAEKIRRAVPGTKVLGYYNSQRDTSVERSEFFRESRLVDSRGKPVTTDWDGKLSVTYSQIATLDNPFGKAMLDVADFYMQDMKLDGLYWDELEVTGFGSPLLTYNKPDGHSCLMDMKTFTIRQDVGLTTLLGKNHRLAVIDRVRAQGGMILANGPICTRAILDAHLQNMTEIQHNNYWAFEGNLQTPLGYMSRRKDFANLVRALNLAMLPAGCSYEYPYNISRYLFPFTPLEIHSGYLLGKERIVTTRSGEFGWPDSCCLAKIHHFDSEGNQTEIEYPIQIANESRVHINLIPGDVVVLERLPIEIKPRTGTAEISQVRSFRDEFSFHLKVGRATRIFMTDSRLTGDRRASASLEIDGESIPAIFKDGKTELVVSGEQTIKIRFTLPDRISTGP
jgi:hypothetical protein